MEGGGEGRDAEDECLNEGNGGPSLGSVLADPEMTLVI